jgi:hypothetical protein
MVDLERNLGPILVHGVGESFKSGHETVVKDPEVVGDAPPDWRNRGVLDDDQADATRRAPAMIGNELVSNFVTL